MHETDARMAKEIATVAGPLQALRTGHVPRTVQVVLGHDTLVITFEDALTPAEIALAKSHEGAAKVQEFHRELFAASSAEMQQEILRITGRHVREAAADSEMAGGVVVQTFATGAMVQVFLLVPSDGAGESHSH